MADIVDAAQQIRVKIRLKMRVKQRSPIHVHLILIRIEHLTFRMFADRFRALIQSVLRHGVIVIRQDNIISPGHGNGGIGVKGDPSVFVQLFIPDAWIPVHIPLYSPKYAGVLRASVRHAQLPVFVGLGLDGIQHLPQIPLRSLI